MSADQSHGPMHQFEIKSLVDLQIAGYDVSFTNSSLFMMVALTLLTLLMTFGVNSKAVVPGRWQAFVELTYDYIASTVRDIVGNAGRKYFPFIFTLFMFILVCNVQGILPYSFTVTSHIVVTFALALVVFLGVTVVAISRHGVIKFCGYFLPPGTPLWLAPLMVVIEVFSYLTRPLSLSIRLAANMMAGHLLLKVIASFVITMGVFGIAPLLFMTILTGFELFVAVLQAYIFTVLTCVYLNDAVHLH